MGNLHIFILLVSANTFVEASFGAYLSDKDKAVEDAKRRLEKLVDDRELTVKVYHDCVLDFKQQDKDKLKTTIQNNFSGLKSYIADVMFIHTHPDYNLVEGLYNFLEREKSETAEEAFTKYEAFLDLIRSNLESETVIDLSTMYWKMVEKFLKDPFDFLGKLSNVTNALVKGYSPNVIPRQPNICIKTFIKQLITKGQMVMAHYQNCAYYFEKGEKKRIEILGQKLGWFKDELQCIVGDDEDGRRFSEKVTDPLDHIETEYFFAMTVDYNFIYLLLDDLLMNEVPNDTYIGSKFWRVVIKFLNRPFEFSGLRLKSENVTKEVGQCLKIDVEFMLEKRRKVLTPYHACSLELGGNKRMLLLGKIKENMANLKGLMNKMRLENKGSDRVLLDFFDVYVMKLHINDLKTGFEKYENVLNFFYNTLTWTEERLDELDTKYWSRVTEFFNGPSIFSGIISNETEKALSEISANITDINQDVTDNLTNEYLNQLLYRMTKIQTYLICGDDFNYETKSELAKAIAEELNSLKNNMDKMHFREKKSNSYLIEDLYSRVWPMWTTESTGFQAVFEVYHHLLDSVVYTLKNGLYEPSQLRKDFWKRIMQSAKMPVL